MRAAPFAVRAEAPKLPALASAIFRAIALARNISKYPARTDEFASAAHGAYAAAYAAADATIVAASGYAAASAYSAVAAAYAVNSAAAAAYAVDTAAGAADGYAGYAARAGAVLWGETHFDLDVTQGFTSGPKEDLPLWSRGTPQWAQEAWANLVAALPKAEDWEVWIEWYEDRLRGGSRGDAYEMAFARAPLDVWNKGPAAAAWIRAHLP